MSTAPNPAAGVEPNAGSPSPDVELNPTEVSQPVEGQETPGEGEQPQPGTEGQPEGQLESREDGRVIPQWMRALKESNPEAYKKAKTDLFELRDRRTVHPTAQLAREEHDLVTSLGGAEGVASMREDMGFFKEAAQQFLKGDPAFVKDLWEEDPIAAALHVQPMLDTFKATDLEGYKSTIARLWDTEFQAVGFGGALKSLNEAISKGDKDAALELIAGFNKWYESIGNVARKAEDPRVKTLLAERAKQRDNEANSQRENFLKDYRTDALNTVVDEGAKIFDSFFRGRKLDAEDRTDLLREAFAIANRAVEADKTFAEQRDRHLQLGDKHSALQLTKSRFAQAMPDAVKRVARRYGLVSGAPPRPQGNQQQPNGQRQQPRPEAGWTAVTVRPSPEEIDRSRTTPEMIVSGKAILKDGKKVDWTRLKQAS